MTGRSKATVRISISASITPYILCTRSHSTVPLAIPPSRQRHQTLTTAVRCACTVLGKLEASPYPPPRAPYNPDTNPDPNYLPWHGHITALTVAPRARRLGHASQLTASLEQQADAHDAWFVDLFVRVENTAAQELYKKLG